MTTALLWIFGIAYVAVCGWLVLVVLMQEGKSGGMAGMDTASQTPSALSDTLGAGAANRGLFKMTSWTAGIFMVLAIVLTLLGNRRDREGGSLLLDDAPAAAVVPNTTAPAAPATDTTAPATP